LKIPWLRMQSECEQEKRAARVGMRQNRSAMCKTLSAHDRTEILTDNGIGEHMERILERISEKVLSHQMM